MNIKTYILIIALVFVVAVYNVSAQSVLYEKKLEPNIKFQVLGCRTSTNMSAYVDPTTKTKLYYSATALFIIVSNNVSTNLVYKKFYVDRDVVVPQHLYPEDKGTIIKPLYVYDVHHDAASGQIGILYAQNSRYVYCPIFKCPPFPGNQLLHNANNRGDDFCCEIKSKELPVPGPFIEKANVLYEPSIKCFSVELDIKYINKSAKRKYVRTADGWKIFK